MTNPAAIALLHEVYCLATGLRLPLDMTRERQWFDWQARGLTPDDLRTVIRYLQAQIKQTKRNPGCLKFSNLVGMPDLFEEDLAMARAAQRARVGVPTGDRASVLRQTGRLVSAAERVVYGAAPATHAPRSAAAVIAKLHDPAAAARAFAELQQLKNDL